MRSMNVFLCDTLASILLILANLGCDYMQFGVSVCNDCGINIMGHCHVSFEQCDDGDSVNVKLMERSTTQAASLTTITKYFQAN